MDRDKVRAWWAHRQGLDGSMRGLSPAAVLERAGWARSVGGVGPYLTFMTRAGIGRQQVDDAVASLEVHELPSARGCTYVVPASAFALALTLADNCDRTDMKAAVKLGASEAEINELCDAVVAALANGALAPDGIREAVGPAARSLGEEGKKKGVNSTLPIALGLLQTRGNIRRIPINGRLDQQRYQYILWNPNPLTKHRLSPSEAYTELARQYFRWTGPATLAEFQWFSALSQKAAKAAIEPLGLTATEKNGDRLMFPDDLKSLSSFRVPTSPQYALVSAVDSIQLLRRNLPSLLAEGDSEKAVQGEKGMTVAGRLTDFPSHAILDRGRLIGFWEFDPDRGEIAWATFVPKDDALRAAVAEMETYVRAQLGDARSFSLDSPKSRAPRIAALRG